ncbi:ARM repeat-containing protein [Schizopora paradoxa]|uniref:ARM repeat-containing protein n=1 Tax=Schizopora paradoxa TaxID=27342 RepID=A0A0H2R493_9AGAM|nr:ARM repeat-containing protein [Schizopora paradoxa]
MDEEEVEENEGEEGDMEVDEGEKAGKSQSNARESHKAQKALQQERKANKQNSALLQDAKRAWSLARQKNIKTDERKKHIDNLMKVVRGKVQEVVLKHDASRIVQTIVKYGGQTERNEIAAELKGHYRALAQSKYSKFLVTKLIRYCPAHRSSILLEFKSHVIRLLLHREACGVISDSYDLYANAYERSLLLQDFYGKEVALFSSASTKGADATESEKASMRKGLAGALEGADAERRKRILAAVKENLDLVLNNTEKSAVSHSIFHHVMWEYLSEVNHVEDETEREKLRREVFEGSQDVLAEMVHTKDGSRVVREFLAQGTAKDRKQIVKTLKPHVEKICKDDDAQLVLFTALDVIDDTKLTAKSLVADITSKAPSLYQSVQGRRSLLYLIVPRTLRHFSPAQIDMIMETDAIRAKTSKKDPTTRQEEIRKAASEGLVATLLDDAGVFEEVLRDAGGSLLVTEIMLYADGEKPQACENLVRMLSAPYPSEDDTKPHIIDIPHSSRAVKTILQGGHFSKQTKAVVPSTSFSPISLVKLWIQTVGKENTQAMAKAGGAFVVATLCDRVRDDGDAKMKKELKGWFDDRFIAQVGDDVRGKSVLLESIRSL